MEATIKEDNKVKSLSDHSLDFSSFALKAWIVFGTAAAFYLYEYVLRVSPSVMTHELMLDFNVTSTALGVLASFYYYSYVALQIPCGVIVDWLGPRKVITFSAALCVIGTLMFANSETLFLAQLGRFLIGAGSACGYLSCAKIGAEWFSPKKFAMIASITMAMGTLGGTFGGRPLAILVNTVGWRSSMFILAMVGIGITFGAWLVIRDRPKEKEGMTSAVSEEESQMGLLDGLKIIASNPQSWLIGIYGGLMYVPLSAFAELWAVPYLQQVYNVNNEVAAMASLAVFVGMAVGCPVSAWISDRLQSRVKVMSWSAILTGITFLAVIYIPNIPFSLMLPLLFLAGIFCAGQILYFAASKEINPHNMSGASIGFCNCLVMVSGIIFQPMLGYILDVAWDGKHALDGTPIYSVEAYQMALLSIPVSLIASWIVLKFVRETYHMTHVVTPKEA